jgi:hypothetical protein
LRNEFHTYVDDVNLLVENINEKNDSKEIGLEINTELSTRGARGKVVG